MCAALKMLNPVIRFTIKFARHSHVGSAEIDLLEAIHKAGSLSQAARDLRISYRHAGLLADSLNYAFQSPVTLAKRGGNGGRWRVPDEIGRIFGR
jgi:molybdate transport system regulatory protein